MLVEVVESIFFDQMKKQRTMVETIKKRLAAELGVGVERQAGGRAEPRAVQWQKQPGDR